MRNIPKSLHTVSVNEHVARIQRQSRERKVFDVGKPGVRVVPSPFGGGWALPISPAGVDALADYFGEPAAPLAPLGGQQGYIVEPVQSSELAEFLRAQGVAWTVDQQRR